MGVDPLGAAVLIVHREPASWIANHDMAMWSDSEALPDA
jgi:hypothetical protein